MSLACSVDGIRRQGSKTLARTLVLVLLMCATGACGMHVVHADAPPPASRPTTTAPSPLRSRHLVINQPISDRVWQKARAARAERGVLIYASAIDPEKDGKVNLDLLQAYIIKEIPPAARGFACLDIESPYFKHLRMDPATDEFQAAQREMLAAIRLAKRMRPQLKWSFYGLPVLPYWLEVPGERWKKTWRDAPDAIQRGKRAHATRPMELLAELDWLAPTIYDSYPNAEKPGVAARDHAFVRAQVGLARAIAGDRPVLPYVLRRYHHNGKPGQAPAFGLIPREEFSSQVTAAMEAGADGVVWWGADTYYVGLAGLSRGPRPGEFDQRTQARWRELLQQERPPGMTSAAYLDLVHSDTLEILAGITLSAPK